MRGFDDLTLEWDGQTYSVPANRQMELILRVEAGLTHGRECQAYEVLILPEGPPLAMFARVYADALRYAGAPADPLDVFRRFTAELRGGNGDLLQSATMDVMRILGLIGADEDEAPKKANTSAKK